MSPSDVQISKVGRESDVLRSLFDDYVHDMAEWFEIPTRADGSYEYDTSLLWGNDADAYLAKIGDSIAGFAIAGSASEWSADTPTHDVREFFVVRSLRRTGVGKRMATLLWNAIPGDWLVRVLELNAPAVEFWRNTISDHAHGLHHEERRIVNGRAWRFFRFVSSR